MARIIVVVVVAAAAAGVCVVVFVVAQRCVSVGALSREDVPCQNTSARLRTN